MAKVEFPGESKIYRFPDHIIDELRNIAIRSAKEGIELGAEFCARAVRDRGNVEITHLGSICEGSDCTIDVGEEGSGCGPFDKVGQFHTHPAEGNDPPTNHPSLHDTFDMQWRAKFDNDIGCDCIIGANEHGDVSNIRCDHIKEKWDKYDFYSYINKLNKLGHTSSDKVISRFDEHFYEPIEISLDHNIPPKPAYREVGDK